jgi:hypothetical protein
LVVHLVDGDGADAVHDGEELGGDQGNVVGLIERLFETSPRNTLAVASRAAATAASTMNATRTVLCLKAS